MLLVEACFHIYRERLGYSQVTPVAKYSHIPDLSKVEAVLACEKRTRKRLNRWQKPWQYSMETLLGQLDEISENPICD